VIDRLLDLAHRRLGFAPSWPALVRIAVWFVVGLVLIDVVLPDQHRDLSADRYNRAAPSRWVRSVTAERGDDRGFTPTTNDGVFKIAWVGGSEIQSIGKGEYTFLPIEVRKQLRRVDGMPVSIDMYFVSGMRIVDEYAAVLAAIDDDVDALVISLNPVWALNDLAVQGWDNLDPTLATKATRRVAGWPLAASLLSPADLLWAVVADRLDVVDDRYQSGVRVRDDLDQLSLIDTEDGAANDGQTSEAAESELDRIRDMQIPVEFWGVYAPTVDPSEPIAVRQAALFERSASSRSRFNDYVLDQMGHAVSNSGIPTMVYTAAVSDDVLDDPATATHLETVEGQLADHAPAFAADNVRFDPRTIARRAPGMTFNDVVHVADLGPLATVMSGDLCSLLDEAGHQPRCEAS
jgi:hypothetical protein